MMRVYMLLMISRIFIVKNSLAAKHKNAKQSESENDSEFAKNIRAGTFIDKSLLIADFLLDNSDFVYVMAPRNFGKTVNLFMIKHFFEIQVDDAGREITDKSGTSNFQLFKKLKIYRKVPELFELVFGKFPVIYISYEKFSNIKDYRDMLKYGAIIVRETFQQHRYLLLNDKLWPGEGASEKFKKYFSNEELAETELIGAVNYLARLLHEHFEKGVIVLIDRYDQFAQSLIFNNLTCSRQVGSLFLGMNDALRNSSRHVGKIFSTGVLSIGGVELTATDRNVTSYRFSHNHGYSEFYGLAEDELTKLIRKRTTNTTEVEKVRKMIRQLCGGYTIPDRKNHEIYNISCALEYFKEHAVKEVQSEDEYTQTLTSLLNMTFVKKEFERTFKDGALKSIVDISFHRRNIADLKIALATGSDLGIIIDEVCNLMLQLGYLTYAGHEAVKFPNSAKQKQVRSMCKNKKVPYTIEVNENVIV